MIGGMTRRSVVLGFLTLNENWNPALLFLFCGALVCNFITFHFILQKTIPALALKFDLPTKTELDGNLIVGSALFGAGWGLAGLCPAPALFGSLFYLPHVIFFFMTPFVVGQYAASYYLGKQKQSEYEIIKDKE